MKPVCRLGSSCTGTLSPFGSAAAGIFFGRVIKGCDNVYANGKPLGTVSHEIFYSGLINLYTGGVQYMSWTGHVISGSNTNFAAYKPIATVGSQTDAKGTVVDGDSGIFA